MAIEFKGKVSSGRIWIPKDVRQKNGIEDGQWYACTIKKLVLKEVVVDG
jgi:bifunctional DNA-binding transcriptional regulator/antitoxin component of YhaV-PrlF toxin-antitoxin module